MEFVFSTIIASRGWHVYGKSTWQAPKDGQELSAENESNSNILKCDPYAVAWKIKFAYKIPPFVVGQVPKEISCFIHSFLIHSGTVTAITCSGTYYPSPIPKGGLDILLKCQFKIKEQLSC